MKIDINPPPRQLTKLSDEFEQRMTETIEDVIDRKMEEFAQRHKPNTIWGFTLGVVASIVASGLYQTFFPMI